MIDPGTAAVGGESTAALSDFNGGVANVRWRWEISDDGVTGWSSIAGAATDTYTPAAGDLGSYLRAVATYDDDHGTNKQAESEAVLVSPLRIDLKLHPGDFAYEFYASAYEPLGDFRFQWKSPSLTEWPTHHQFNNNCAMPGITRPGAIECGWEYVSPGRRVARQMADLVLNHAGAEYDFRIVGELRGGGELYSNTVRTLVGPDPQLGASTEYGIKAWRVDTAQRFIVEWHLDQSCPANQRFYLRFDSTPALNPMLPAVGVSWRTPGRAQHGRQLFAGNEPDEVYIFCATGARDPNFGHIYATADIADIGTEPVLGPEVDR